MRLAEKLIEGLAKNKNMDKKEVLDVKDWSQPYKLAVYAIAILGFAGFVWFWVVPFADEALGLLKQIAENTK